MDQEKEKDNMPKNSLMIKLYLASIVLIGLITLGAYLVESSTSNGVNASENKVNPEDLKSFILIDKGNGVIQIYAKDYPVKNASDTFDAIDSGFSELRSNCTVDSRVPLVWNGTTIGYSVTILDTPACNMSKPTKKKTDEQIVRFSEKESLMVHEEKMHYGDFFAPKRVKLEILTKWLFCAIISCLLLKMRQVFSTLTI